MLDRLPILIVEDEPLLAMLLAQEVEDRQGVVVGVADSVAAALAFIESRRIAAAIMDANLTDAQITPVALKLLDAGIPFVIYTGTGLPDALSHRSAEITVVMKPGQPTEKLIDIMGLRRD